MASYQLLVFDAHTRAALWQSAVEAAPMPAISRGDDWIVGHNRSVVQSVGHQIAMGPGGIAIYQTLIAISPAH